MLKDGHLARGHAAGGAGCRLVELKGILQRLPQQRQVIST